jgi:predicted DNA binding CopG/RHH family protein
MKRKLAAFKSDKEAEDFLDGDLSDYLHVENFAPFVFEYQPKQKSINLRISEQLLSAVRADARPPGVPYQRYSRQALEAAVRKRARA